MVATICLSIPLAALASGVATADEPPTMAVIVHPSNPVDSLSDAELESIFTSTRNHWSGGGNIAAFHYAPHDPLRVAFDRAVLRMDPSEVSRFWIDQRIRGRKQPPRTVPTASLMVRVVERLPSAIGYAPVDQARSANVKIVARIENKNVSSP